jgi:hypothetical protein
MIPTAGDGQTHPVMILAKSERPTAMIPARPHWHSAAEPGLGAPGGPGAAAGPGLVKVIVVIMLASDRRSMLDVGVVGRVLPGRPRVTLQCC